MSEQIAPAGAPGSGAPVRRHRGRAAMVIVLVALAGGIAGGAVTRAFGQGAWHPGAMMMGGPIDPDKVDQNIDRMTRHFAVEVDATVEQQAKLAVIAKAAAKDLLPLREQAQRTRQEGLDLLTAATVDRAAIERLRARKIELAETASKRIAQALADVAEVLTPEQRKAFAERMSQGPWGRWHRG